MAWNFWGKKVVHLQASLRLWLDVCTTIVSLYSFLQNWCSWSLSAALTIFRLPQRIQSIQFFCMGVNLSRSCISFIESLFVNYLFCVCFSLALLFCSCFSEKLRKHNLYRLYNRMWRIAYIVSTLLWSRGRIIRLSEGLCISGTFSGRSCQSRQRLRKFLREVQSQMQIPSIGSFVNSSYFTNDCSCFLFRCPYLAFSSQIKI